MNLKFDGDKLKKELRTKRVIELDLNIRDAAKEIGISAATLSRIENGRKPGSNNLKLITLWLKVPMDYFYTLQKPKSSKK